VRVPGVCPALHSAARGYRRSPTEPKFWDVDYLRALGAVCVMLGATSALAQPAPQQRPGQLPTLPLTQLDDRALAADLDNRAFTLTFAQPVPIKDLLLLLVRGTNLSVVPDPSVGGSFIGELKNVTVRQALGLILRPLGLDYAVDGSFVRVFKREPETRIFDLNYVATGRIGTSSVGGEPGPSVATPLARSSARSSCGRARRAPGPTKPSEAAA